MLNANLERLGDGSGANTLVAQGIELAELL